MRSARARTGFLRHFYIHRMEQIGLETSSDVVDEIWAAICYFADVPDAGKELLKSRGIAPDRLEDAYTSLQSFLRQGRAFFAAARGASGRSSPLIYYYSFLNLVKALICLKWPDRVRERIPHGLSHQLKDGALEIQTISVTDQGVFHLLYELLLDEKVPSGLMFDVFSLLTYCGDIATEVVWVKNGRMRTLHGKSRIQVNGDEIYATLGVLNFENFEDCPSAKERFYKTFEEVDLGKDQKRSEFSLFAEETTGWRFFETIDTAKGPDRNLAYKKIYTQCCDALRPFLLEHPYQTDRCDFNLCRPL